MSNITQGGFYHALSLKSMTASRLEQTCAWLWVKVLDIVFALQDGFQEHYKQTGRYPGPTVTPPRRPWDLLNWLFWACLLLYPLCLLLARLVTSGSILTILASVALCSAGWCHPFASKAKSP